MNRSRRAEARTIAADHPSWWAIALLTLSVGLAALAATLLVTAP